MSYLGDVILGYKELVEFDKKYREDGLVILGFPCNQFGGQEPGTKEQIREFVGNYGVEFQMFEKVKVNGKETHPLWEWLKNQKKGVLGTTSIKWNFSKFLVDRDGKVIERLSPTTTLASVEKKLLTLLERKCSVQDASKEPPKKETESKDSEQPQQSAGAQGTKEKKQ